MSYNSFLVEKSEGIATVTYNRPKVLNAMDNPTLIELKDIMEGIKYDPEVICVILTGGGRAFSVGSDLKSPDLPTDPTEYHEILGQQAGHAIEMLPKPVIAAINGFAVGGGMEMALACDIRFASEDSTFGLPEVELGDVPRMGGSQRLTRTVGAAYAKELMFLGEQINTQEALRIGLVNHVVPKADLMKTARAFALKLTGKHPVALERIKFLCNHALDIPVSVGAVFELLQLGSSGTISEPGPGSRAYEAVKAYKARFAAK